MQSNKMESPSTIRGVINPREYQPCMKNLVGIFGLKLETASDSIFSGSIICGLSVFSGVYRSNLTVVELSM